MPLQTACLAFKITYPIPTCLSYIPLYKSVLAMRVENSAAQKLYHTAHVML
jgi:hypothetical protein